MVDVSWRSTSSNGWEYSKVWEDLGSRWGLSEFWGLNWEEAKEAFGVGKTSIVAKRRKNQVRGADLVFFSTLMRDVWEPKWDGWVFFRDSMVFSCIHWLFMQCKFLFVCCCLNCSGCQKHDNCVAILVYFCFPFSMLMPVWFLYGGVLPGIICRPLSVAAVQPRVCCKRY